MKPKLLDILALTGVSLMVMTSPAMAQKAILPQGDPTESSQDPTESSQEQRDDIRDKRLKQQGQGPNYRIEGKSPSKDKADTDVQAGKGPGLERQDTGLSDPTVNPGQAGK